MHVLGTGPLAMEIAAALRAAVPTRRVITGSRAYAFLPGNPPPAPSRHGRGVIPSPLPDAGSAFVVGVAEGDATALLDDLNRRACAAGVPWLPVRIAADRLLFGPTVLPGATACLCCTDLRRRAAGIPNPPAPFPSGEGESVGDGAPSPTDSDSGSEAVPLLAAREALYALVGAASPVRGQLGILDLRREAWSWHPVLRHPRCPVCEALPWPPPAEPPPDEHDSRAPFVDPETGIVAALVAVALPEGEPEPPHVAVAFRANTHLRDDWAALPLSARIATGKGWTAEAARRAALGEALERYCAAFPPSPPIVRFAPRAALDGPAIGPEAVGLYRAAQYADGSVPYRPVTDATPLHWMPARSLTHDRAVHVPADFVAMHPLDHICQQTSSGLAAGATFAAAALHALCEVIERDAFLVAWLTRRPAPRLDLRAAGPAVAALVGHYAAREVALTAADLTAETGVPVILLRAHDRRGRAPIDLFGLGCDPDPARAIERAALELVQQRRARWDVIAASGAPAVVRTPTDHGRRYALADHGDMLRFLGETPGLLPPRVGDPDADTGALLAAVVDALARAGYEAIIAAITTPDVRAAGMTVVRALVPGLLPMHFGAGQERLGSPRLAHLPTSSLNRAPHPLA